MARLQKLLAHKQRVAMDGGRPVRPGGDCRAAGGGSRV